MEKIILVDGNNLLFRSYYATAYNGNFMKNSKGFPTNALFGFTNMMNKIITEEKPTYIIVAFDKGKTFRHEKYKDYKSGRLDTPDELKIQFPIAKELLTAMGIKYYECDNYEADDIIGTFARFCDEDEDFIGTIISSDKDLLQLLSSDVDIKLLKQKDYIRYNPENFKEEFGIEPIRVIDLKALMGDASDNIPGVKGIGEKTALKLLKQYETLDSIYENIDEIKGSVHNKLVEQKESAYASYELATIIKDVPMEISLDDVKYKSKDIKSLYELYDELEFYSFLKKEGIEQERNKTEELEVRTVTNSSDIKFTKDVAVYLEILGTNYHMSSILGLAVYNDEDSIFIPKEALKECFPKIAPLIKITYDLKKLIVALHWEDILFDEYCFDTMVASYLLDYNVKDDIAYLANSLDYEIPFYEESFGKSNYTVKDETRLGYNALLKARFIYETYSVFEDKLKLNQLTKLYEEIELPLINVLARMELNGVCVDVSELDKMGDELKLRIDIAEKEIYEDAGEEFNISSPKQLGEILFEKLSLPHGKKTKSGYSTSADILNKIKGKHLIVDKILEYRTITKLYTTYVEGLKKYIKNGKIHTIYTQALTRTGRLSSIEPNLQNIPIRYEYGRLIRKAFVASPNSIMVDADYSQIELRILSDRANVESMIKAFEQGIDIHTKTASDIFSVSTDEVNYDMRRIAKAVNFGIVYGISSFGLSENLEISNHEAKEFISKYMETYPEIQNYKESIIKEAYDNGFVSTLMNRKRYIPELKNKNYLIRSSGERIALNTPIQGTSADIIKKAMVEIDYKFQELNLKSKMILQVHDELVFDTLLEEKEEVMKIVKDTMEHICELRIPLKIEVSTGYNWYEAK